MRSNKMVRSLALLAASALVLGAFTVAPAHAAKKCKKYVPGDYAAEAETTVVTSKATSKKPVEVTLSTLPGAGFTSPDGPEGETGVITHVYHNVQVDAAAKSARLFVRLEFLYGNDYDLYIRTPEGAAVAYAAGFNQVPGLVDGGSGGHSEETAEQIDGLTTGDCGGWSVDIASSNAIGGDVLLKFWLEK